MVNLECVKKSHTKYEKLNTHTELKDLFTVAQILSIQSGQQLRLTQFVNVQNKQSEKLNNINSIYRSFKSNLILKKMKFVLMCNNFIKKIEFQQIQIE